MDTTNIEGFGSTIDVILIDGELEVGDKIALSTLDGPIITTIRNLLTPPPNRESRIKSEYIHHTKIKGSMGIKIFANNLIKTLSGTSLLKITNNKEDILEIAKINCDNANKFILQNEGVTVHSSTLGSLEALVYFLQNECNPPIPISKVNIGKVMKKDIIKTYLSNEKVNKEYSVILAFNVEIDEDAVIESKNNDIKIFSAEIIYHLFDQFKKYKDCIELEKKEKAKNKVVFPCILKIMPDCIFNKKNPLVLGVEVIEGNLHLNTPLYIPSLNLYVGKVIGIQNNKKDINIGKKNSTICIKIENEENPLIYYGRHFDNTNNLYSKISRESIDVIKEFFRNDITNDDIQLLGKLKKVFAIN
jgi:translation initiation factor 5B